MLEITPELLLQAYRIGVFPMGERRDDPKLYWLDPRLRAILPLDAFHLPKRLARTMRQGVFEVTADAAFIDVRVLRVGDRFVSLRLREGLSFFRGRVRNGIRIR